MDLNKMRFGNKKTRNRVVNELYRTSVRYCIAALCKRGADLETAKDIFQDSIMAFIERVMKDSNFVLSVDAKIYVARICKHKYIDFLRKQDRIPIIDVLDYKIQDHIDGCLGELERKRVIEHLMKVFREELKEECQAILKAFYFDKKSLKEIASLRKITPNSAKTQKSRCIRYLREMVVDLERA
ncbi:RNA polymerase sigma factor [Aureispira anguillae]|uniref:Sigma-70 family RNA polymerase sigma factor n=1 Tax=Aureispira anguillae TaxID=2864201 RepID=A0A915VJV4_9BACT|nr:sigma-70 family RNA polymerase sigma factor [Aureispira anguillae]BDS09366.1 sigma-70 family RNA polymerase sigma factor [Aureispira anguillae]